MPYAELFAAIFHIGFGLSCILFNDNAATKADNYNRKMRGGKEPSITKQGLKVVYYIGGVLFIVFGIFNLYKLSTY